MKMVFTDSVTSAPIPSPRYSEISETFQTIGSEAILPGIKVTVYFPPYLVGFTRSEATVAIAIVEGSPSVSHPRIFTDISSKGCAGMNVLLVAGKTALRASEAFVVRSSV